MIGEELRLRMVEEEAEQFGGSIVWLPVDRPECAGGVPVAHVLIGGWAYDIPLERCTNREQIRAWLQSCINAQRNGQCPGSNGHYQKLEQEQFTQLEFDL